MENILAENLKKLRHKKGLSQQRLAEKLGLSYAMIQSIEIGRVKNPKKITLVKLADVFGISIDDLIGRKIPPSKNQ